MPLSTLPRTTETAPAHERPEVAMVVNSPACGARLRTALTLGGVDCALQLHEIADLALEPSVGRLDAIVLWITGDRASLLTAFATARSLCGELPIVAVWPDAQRREDRRTLKVGINGIVPVDRIETALVPTVRAVASGLVCIPQPSAAASKVQALSSREKQVLSMLIMGFTNAEIGRRLFLAESTVKSHLSSAYLKLGVRSRKDAAAIILDPDHGLGTGILAISGA